MCWEGSCARDVDGDGVPDAIDNCRWALNPDQQDTAGNGIGDACDWETDCDGDGLSDAFEYWLGSDPSDPHSIAGDGQTTDSEAWEGGLLPGDDPDESLPDFPRTSLWHARLVLGFEYRHERPSGTGQDVDEVRGLLSSQFAIYRPVAYYERWAMGQLPPIVDDGIWSLPMGIPVNQELPILPGIGEVYGGAVYDYECSRNGGTNCREVNGDPDLRWNGDSPIEGTFDASTSRYLFELSVPNQTTSTGGVRWERTSDGSTHVEGRSWFDALEHNFRDPALSCSGENPSTNPSIALAIRRSVLDRGGTAPIPIPFSVSNQPCEGTLSPSDPHARIFGVLLLTPVHIATPEHVMNGQDRRAGETQFVYDAGVPQGRLIIPHTLHHPQSAEDSLNDGVCWKMAQIGDGADSITTEFEGGRDPSTVTLYSVLTCSSHTHHRVGLATTITHVGLPRANDSFGAKRTNVFYLNQPIDVVDHEVFFDKHQDNHPGDTGAGSSGSLPFSTYLRLEEPLRNQTYYYMQASEPPIPWWYTDRIAVVGEVEEAELALASYTAFMNGRPLHGGPFLSRILIYQPAIELNLRSLASLILGHEMQHHHDFRVEVWDNNPNYDASLDSDGSHLRDTWQIARPCPIDPNNWTLGWNCFREWTEANAAATQHAWCMIHDWFEELDWDEAEGPNWGDRGGQGCEGVIVE